MATIVTRAGKGSPLTNAEVDANFTNLNSDKAELSGAAFTGIISTTKKITPNVQTVTSASTITPNADADTQVSVTALATVGTTTIAAPSGAPSEGQSLIIRIKDDGTARVIGWNGIYRPVGITLPLTTVATKTTYIGFKYNFTDSRWDAIALSQEV
jgi:hypothetical protein